MGFTKPTTTQTPDALFDYWLTRLSDAELRVTLYTVRHTFGYGKESDAISIDQYVRGIRRSDGTVVDEGCGLSRSGVFKAIKALTEKGLLLKTRQKRGQGSDDASSFRLQLIDYRRAAAGGFAPVNTTQVPDELFDYWLPRLSDSELRVLLYIIRRTLGFGKVADIIPRAQFYYGITTRDGVVFDDGCRVSEKALYRALRSLGEKGLIAVEQRIDPRYGSQPPRYRLVFEGELPALLAPVVDPRTLGEDDGQRVSRVRGGLPKTEAGSMQNRRGIDRRQIQGPQMADPGSPNDRTRVHVPPTPGAVETEPGSFWDRSTVHQGRRPEMSPVDPQQTDDIQENTEQERQKQETRQQQNTEDTWDRVVGRLQDQNPHPSVPALSIDRQAYELARTVLAAFGVRGRVVDELIRYPSEVLYQAARLQDALARGTIDNPAGWLVEAIRSRHRMYESRAGEDDGPASHEGGEVSAATATDTSISEPDGVWRAVLEDLHETMTAPNFARWLAPTRVVAVEGTTRIVAVRDAFHKEWLDHKLADQIRRALARHGYAEIEVCYRVDQEIAPDER